MTVTMDQMASEDSQVDMGEEFEDCQTLEEIGQRLRAENEREKASKPFERLEILIQEEWRIAGLPGVPRLTGTDARRNGHAPVGA
jgi:hypothetical protein